MLVIYVRVGDLPAAKADQFIKNLINRYNKKGEIEDIETFWIATKEPTRVEYIKF